MPAKTVRLMQRLAQQVWLAHRETVNSGATAGQLAWDWGSGRAAGIAGRATGPAR